MNIVIYKDGNRLETKSFLFPGGEIGFKLDANDLKYKSIQASYQTIVAHLQNANDIMTLIMAVNALRKFDKTPVRLFLTYCPYARQDRFCVPGESFSLKAFAELINSLNFELVTIVDPHSDVVGAVFNNVNIITQFDVINKYQYFIEMVIKEQPIFVSPDAGSNKKTSELAKFFSHSSFLRADKLRNLETGAIIETIVYADKITQPVIIADDICDGGKTFIELAKVLKAKGAPKVTLYVTHGIFSKGTDVLFQNGIDNIYTTDSFMLQNGNVTTLHLKDVFKL